jgi:CheY-like chemotaxis protein
MNIHKTDPYILVVDDESLICEMLRRILKAKGYRVSVANNGIEALLALAEHDFDLVFMDVQMPVMDGLTATKFIRKCEQGDHLSITEHKEIVQPLHSRRQGTRIPIVAITGNVSNPQVVLQAGMDEYIPKPFNLDMIYDTISRLAGKKAGNLSAERRRHTRYQTDEYGRALFKTTAGLVFSMSNDGMAINLLGYFGSLPNTWKTNFYCKATGAKIKDLPVKLVREGTKNISQAGIEAQTVWVSFDHPTDFQREQIKDHLSSIQSL